MATLSYALNRYKWGNLERSNPSRFLREIDQQYLTYPHTGGKPYGSRSFPGQKYSSFDEETRDYPVKARLKKLARTEPVTVTAFNGGEPAEFNEGDRVEHDRFGAGVILTIEGQPPNITATVEFENGGSKKLLLRFAKLRKV